MVITGKPKETTSVYDIIHDVQIEQQFYYKDHAFATFSGEIPVQYKPSGKVDLLRISQRGFTAAMKNLQACQFNIPEPREAKCCQPWLDTVYDPNDRFETIGIEKIKTIRNLHAVVNSLKLLQCLKCGRQTPGLNTRYSELNVLQKRTKDGLKRS